jgi:hypothetical protein
MTKRGGVTLCAWDTCDHDRTSAKNNRSKAYLLDMGLDTFKHTHKRLMGRMKTKQGA